jgi:hypothetical protein
MQIHIGKLAATYWEWSYNFNTNNLWKMSIFEACSSETHSETVLGEGVEAIKNIPYGGWSRHLVDIPATGFPLQRSSWDVKPLHHPGPDVCSAWPFSSFLRLPNTWKWCGVRNAACHKRCGPYGGGHSHATWWHSLSACQDTLLVAIQRSQHIAQ